jgi:prepilin-type N-terminal cleavage/methylation domain-containing protein
MHRTIMPRLSTRLPRPRDGRRSGFTVIEMIITMAIVVVASGILARAMGGANAMRTVGRENSRAVEASLQTLERMRNQPFESLFALYNADPSDDPDGAGTAPGATFAVPNLEPLAGGGPIGHVHLPALLVEIPAPEPTLLQVLLGGPPPPPPTFEWQLREDFVDEKLGMPRDLNGDNVIDDQDHAHDYIVLPVRVRTSWAGLNGDRSTELYTMLGGVRRRRTQ